MRIFFVASGIPTKQNPLLGVFEMDQAKALSKLGHEIIYLSIDLRSIRRKRPLGFNSYQIENVPVEELSIPLGNIPRQMLFALGEKAFKQLYKRAIKKYGKPDIVHSHFADISCMTSRGLAGSEMKHVITEHSSQLNRQLNDFDKYEFKKAYERADIVISVSNSLKNRIFELFGVSGTCINNIADLEAFTFSEKTYSKKGFSYITVAGLNENKNVQSLLEAFKEVYERHDDVRMTIVGDGPQKNILKNMISDYKLDKNVIMTGVLQRHEINRLFAESDCFVLPSKSETFGVAYIEAMAAGLPVIATKCGGPEDFVNKENGILLEENSIECLTIAMLDIYNRYDKYDGKRISEFARERFSEQTVSKQIEQVYKSII